MMNKTHTLAELEEASGLMISLRGNRLCAFAPDHDGALRPIDVPLANRAHAEMFLRGVLFERERAAEVDPDFEVKSARESA